MKHEVDKERRMDDTKALWHMDRVIDHFDKGKRVAPVHIDMGIAKFCNVACVFCYGQYQKMAPVYIGREALFRTMKEAGECGVRSIAVIGDGEPTCNPHLAEALDVGKAYGLSLATSTNGVLLDKPATRDSILRNCDWMRFCFSAGTREGYKRIHGKDYFNRVVKNIRDLVEQRDRLESKCDIGLQAVFVPTLMAEEMVEEAKLARDLGVDYFVIKQCSIPAPGENNGMMDFDLDDYDKPEVQDALKRAEDLSTERTKIIPKWNLIAQKGRKPYQGCGSIPLISEISGNGDWYPCGYMFGADSKFKKDFRFGNVEEQSFREILESDRYWDIVDRMKQFDVQKDCKGCCRQDKVNEFVWKYLNKPRGLDFI